MKLNMKLAAAALLTMALSSAAAYADSITFTLANPNQNVVYTGGSVTYIATVFAPSSNSGAVFLNGDSFNATFPSALDDSDFFTNFPLSLAPGSSYTGDLFVLTLPSSAANRTYLGTFTLLGGANGSSYNTLGTVNFSLATVTPEPSSVFLLLTGMVLLWVAYRSNLRGCTS